MDEQKLAEIEARAKAAVPYKCEFDMLEQYRQDIPDLIAHIRELERKAKAKEKGFI